MFRRKITEALQQWKASSLRAPLILQGLRQIGKTTAAFDFANENYANAFYVDFRKQKRAHALFDGDFDINYITFAISSLPRDPRLKTGSQLEEGKTLFIFDEIQDCPNARSSLKYFKEDGRFDVLCTGSLLGVKGYRTSGKSPSRGIGVGSEDVLNMYPMDFEEFLWALGVKEEAIALLRDCLKKRKQVPEMFHNMFSDFYARYLIIGGMPEAVKAYLEFNDYQAVRKIQKRLLTDYRSDFGTHLNDALELQVDDIEQALISETFDSVPRQLAKENKKFQYSVIKPRGDARTYSFAINYLRDYGLLVLARNLSNLDYPLDYFAKDDQFKTYFADEGLFMAMLDDEIPYMVLNGDLGSGKGMLYENLVACAFQKMERKLYYYRRDSGLEIDFVSTFGGEIALIEVKAKSGSTKAASAVMNDENSKAKHLIRIQASNLGYVNNILTIPHYMTFLLDNYKFDQ